jgi:hypothetical protein
MYSFISSVLPANDSGIRNLMIHAHDPPERPLFVQQKLGWLPHRNPASYHKAFRWNG